MEIKTKFNVGDEIYFLHDNEIKRSKVKVVHVINSDIESYQEIYKCGRSIHSLDYSIDMDDAHKDIATLFVALKDNFDRKHSKE